MAVINHAFSLSHFTNFFSGGGGFIIEILWSINKINESPRQDTRWCLIFFNRLYRFFLHNIFKIFVTWNFNFITIRIATTIFTTRIFTESSTGHSLDFNKTGSTVPSKISTVPSRISTVPSRISTVLTGLLCLFASSTLGGSHNFMREDNCRSSL